MAREKLRGSAASGSPVLMAGRLAGVAFHVLAVQQALLNSEPFVMDWNRCLLKA